MPIKRTALKLLERITHVEAKDGRVLCLCWADGLVAEVDVSTIVDKFAVAAPLRDATRFSQAKVGEEGVTVDFGDDLEIPTDHLRRLAYEQAGKIMAVGEFRAWRTRNGLSLTQAAAALGINRRTVSYYESGQHLIPRTIMLACLGYETLQDKKAA